MQGPIKTSDYKNLDVWKLSMDFLTDIYGLIRLLPPEERFALCDQLRRAAISVPSNIAEGQTRNSSKEFIHFLSISKGSLAEIETQLIICQRLGYITEETLNEFTNRLSKLSRMIVGLMNYLQRLHHTTPYHQPNNTTTQQHNNL